LSPCHLVILLLVAAQPGEDWIRAGNDAYQRQEYAAALDHYTRAEKEAADPGLVAFNKAAAYYQLGKFAEAEQGYRCALADAEHVSAARHVQSLYGLANALVERSRPPDDPKAARFDPHAAVARLLEAQQSYNRCLKLREDFLDARHNLDVCERLLIELRKMAQETSAPPSEEPKSASSENSSAGTQQRSSTENETSDDGNTGRKGSRLAPLPENKDATPLRPEEAQEYLKEALQRMNQEMTQRSRPGGTRPVNRRDY
jgi:tetratricopeptide (TPR) repeat protein